MDLALKRVRLTQGPFWRRYAIAFAFMIVSFLHGRGIVVSDPPAVTVIVVHAGIHLENSGVLVIVNDIVHDAEEFAPILASVRLAQLVQLFEGFLNAHDSLLSDVVKIFEVFEKILSVVSEKNSVIPNPIFDFLLMNEIFVRSQPAKRYGFVRGAMSKARSNE